MMLETLVTDNPLITKHLRSRLRKRELLTPAAILALVCLFVLMQDAKGRIWGLIVVQAITLFIVGTYQVESAVNRARVSRLVDFHRFSPLSPFTVVLGFLFGAPVREWLMAAALVPFEISLLPTSDMGAETLCLLLASMAVCAVLYHLVGLVAALVASGSRATSAGTVIVLVLQFFWMVPPFSALTIGPAGQLALLSSDVTPLSPSPPALEQVVQALVHQGVFIVFLLIGAIRKMQREDAHFTSKAGGLLFFFVFCFLALIDVRGAKEQLETLPIVYLYPVTALAMAFVAAVTPGAREFASGVRRAVRMNERRLPRWSDAAPNWTPLIGLSAVTVVTTCTVQWLCQVNQGLPYSAMPAVQRRLIDDTHLGPSLAIAIASLVTFACVLQGAELRYGRKHARTYCVLMLMLYWVAPVLLGLADSRSPSVTLLTGFSPWVGMGLAFSGAVSSSLLVGVHLCVAAYAAWWCWLAERAASTASKMGAR